ncbi:hypothetical protein ABW20_dc0107496 [Dactylellina cionopaga]|nr:hypothetical protein ABW20_dc0107496 [Dactylellina cionopaga]
MVSKSLFVLALSSFGLGINASPVVDFRSIPIVPLVPHKPNGLLNAGNAGFDNRVTAKLLPIREAELYPHLQKRGDELSSLHLQEAVTLHYGGIIDGQRTHLANVTVQKPDPDHPLILLEDFDGFTESITCADNKMILKFESKDVMKYAVKNWNWVNRDSPAYFYLVTFHKHEGCGEVDDRTSFKITAVVSDESTLTATLTKEKASWNETAQKFQLKLSTIETPAGALEYHSRTAVIKRDSNLAKRDVFTLGLAVVACNLPSFLTFLVSECEPYRIITNPSQAFANIGDGFKNEFRKELAGKMASGASKFEAKIPAPWSFSWGNRSETKEIAHFLGSYAALEVDTKVACVGCFAESRPTLNLELTRVGDTADIDILLQPNFKSKLDIAVQGSIGLSTDLNGLALPIQAYLDSIAVGEFINVMPDIANGPGIEVKGTLDLDLDLGFEVDTGKGAIGMHIGDQITFTSSGWDTMKINPISNIRKASVKGEINPYIRVGIGLGFDILGGVFKRGAFAGLEIKRKTTNTLGKNTGEPCDEKVGFTSTDQISANIIYKVVLDPLSKFMLEKVVGVFGYELPELEGNIKEVFNPKPATKCFPFSKGNPLNIPLRPEAQSLINRMKNEKLNELRGKKLTVNSKVYTYVQTICPNGQMHVVPYNSKTHGFLFTWCDGRAEKVEDFLSMLCTKTIAQCFQDHHDKGMLTKEDLVETVPPKKS